MKRNIFLLIIILFCASNLLAQPTDDYINNMEGTTFVFSVPPIVSSADKSEDEVVITIISQEYTNVNVTARYGFVKLLEMKPFEKVTVSLPTYAAFPYQKSSKDKVVEEAIYDAAIRIEATKPISVSVAVKNDKGGEGFAVLPIESLGRKYIVSSFNDASNYYSDAESLPSIVAITANYGNTHVRFKLGGNLETKTAGGVPVGNEISAILSPGEVWVISSSGANADLSGSKIEANLPISVVSANQCTNIPLDNPPCNYIVEMELPVNTYGKVFLVPVFPDRKFSPLLRVFAKEPNTTIEIINENKEKKIIPNTNNMIHSGYLEFRINAPNSAKPAFIISDKPISITLYNSGSGEDNIEASSQVTASPFQMVLIPHEQELESYLFAIPESNGEKLFEENIACLITELDVSEVEDKNFKIQDNFKFGEFNGVSWHWGAPSIIQRGDMLSFAGTLDSGKKCVAAFYDINTLSTCQIVSDRKFALYLYGQSRGAGAYGTIAGMGLKDLTSNDSLAPVPIWEMLCGGNVVGTIEDKPDNEENRSNLTLPIFYASESFNYDKQFSQIIPGVTSVANWKLFVRDKNQDAKAVIKFSDKAGNDTTITIEYVAPKISINPQKTNFNIVKLNDIRTKDINIQNNSKNPFFIEKIYFKNKTPYFQILNPPLGEILPNEIKQFQVQFIAEKKGVFCDTIVVEDSCAMRDMASFEAVVDNAEIFAQDLNFGEQLVKTTTKKECYVRNNGNCELKIYEVILPKSSVFTVDFPEEFSPEKPIVLEKGKMMKFIVTFIPSETKHYIDSLIFISDAFGVDSITVINAIGVDPGLVAESYNWGKRRIYRDEFPVKAQPVENGHNGIRLSNKSDFDIKIDTVYIVDETGSKNGFIFDDIALKSLIGKTLKPHQDYILPVDFLPTELKEYVVRVRYVSETGKTSHSRLEGKGVVPNYNIIYENFDTLLINNFEYPQVKTISIENLKTNYEKDNFKFDDTLTIFSIESPDNSVLSNEYSVSGFKSNIDESIFPVKLEPGEVFNFTCSFVPPKIGENIAKLSVKSNALEDKEIEIKGYGTGKSILCQSEKLTLCRGEKGVVNCLIKNNSSSVVTLNNFYLSNKTTVFSIKGNLENILLAPNEVKRVEILFEPKTLGNYEEYLYFNIGTKGYQTSDSVAIFASSELSRRFVEIIPSHNKINISTPFIAKVNLLDGIELEKFSLDKFMIKVSYNSDILLPQLFNISIGPLLAGKFIIDKTDFNLSKKEIYIYVRNISDQILAGAGEMLSIPFSTFFPLSANNSVDISVDINTYNDCITFVPDAINVVLDDVCAYELRRLNISNTKYQLEIKTSNPVVENEVKVEFGIGLNKAGKTKIMLYSNDGLLISNPVNDYLEAGKYELIFNTSSLASGVYYFVIKSAHFYKTAKFVYQK